MTDVVCCPLSNDGDGPSCHSQRTRKARKPHRCSECREEIPAGAAYEYVSGIWDGSPSVYKCRAVEARDNKCGSCRACWSPDVRCVNYPQH